MTEQTRWEYRIRAVNRAEVTAGHLLSQSKASDNPTPAEVALNQLADEGWDLMPIAVQLGEDFAALVFRRPKQTEGGVEGLVF